MLEIYYQGVVRGEIFPQNQKSSQKKKKKKVRIVCCWIVSTTSSGDTYVKYIIWYDFILHKITVERLDYSVQYERSYLRSHNWVHFAI